MSSKAIEKALFGTLVLLSLFWFVYTASGYNAKARFAPLIIGIPTLALAIYCAQSDWRAARRGRVEPTQGGSSAGSEWRSSLWIVGCFVSIYLLGFTWGLPLYSFLYAKVRGKEKWLRAAVLTIATYAIVMVFTAFLRIPLHRGIIFDLLNG